MRNACRHLTQCAKLLSPDQSILREPEVVKRLLQLLVLVRFVEADGGQLRQPFNQGPLPLVERMRFRIQNNQSTEERRAADQRQDSEIVALMHTRSGDRRPEIGKRTNVIQIKTADFPVFAGTERRQQNEIARWACAYYQRMKSPALLHNSLSEQREYAFGSGRIRDPLAELNQY